MNKEKLKQMAEAHQRLHGLMDAEKNSYLSGLKDALNLPEVKALRESLKYFIDTYNPDRQSIYEFSRYAHKSAKKALADLEGVMK